MRRINYYCDKCGKPLIIGKPWMQVDRSEKHYDFCDECEEVIQIFINNFLHPQEPEAPEPAPEAPRKVIPKAPPGGDRRSLKLDLGKVGALHAAGWSNAKIAQEMGCSPQTIGNHLDKAIKVYEERQEMLANAEPDREL